MPRKITITAGALTVGAELNDSPTARKIIDSLPITSMANTWGDEIYFEIPVLDEVAVDAREDVEVGELGYWPTGRAFCIFFGPTPASTGDKPRAASEVNIVGRVVGDATAFRRVASGETVTLS